MSSMPYGFDGLPREDISAKITPNLLRSLSSTDWKRFLSDVLKCLGDNKKHTRECTLNTLDSWIGVVQLDKMVPYIITVLSDSKLSADGRKDLFDWLSRHLSSISDSPDTLRPHLGWQWRPVWLKT